MIRRWCFAIKTWAVGGSATRSIICDVSGSISYPKDRCAKPVVGFIYRLNASFSEDQVVSSWLRLTLSAKPVILPFDAL